MTDSLNTTFRRMAAQAGADLIGIAPIERFQDVPAAHHPASIFPETRSVIALGKRITRGCLRGIEEGTQFHIYRQYAMHWVRDRFLALITITVASWLEDNGWEAIALPDLPPQVPPTGIAVRPDAPPPNVMVNIADAAVRAGLGEIGLTGELMTRQFGPLQRVHLILTDAELQPDPVAETSVCDRCGACAEACPLGAIHHHTVTERVICGQRAAVAAIDKERCLHCRNGAWPNPFHPSGDPDRLGAACMRACLTRLEARGCLDRTFRKPFRRRPAWAVGGDGQPRDFEEVAP